jgi:multidrug efflux pump subunit AcrA (membrane-fusion protein)
MAKVSIAEAGHRLGISQDTVRKRLRLGELTGTQVRAPGGFRWMVELPDDMPGGETKKNGNKEAEDEEDQSLAEAVAALSARVEGQQELIEALQSQIQSQKDQLEARSREVQELHVLLQQAQAVLPAPRDNRPWWHKLWHRNGR